MSEVITYDSDKARLERSGASASTPIATNLGEIMTEATASYGQNTSQERFEKAWLEAFKEENADRLRTEGIDPDTVDENYVMPRGEWKLPTSVEIHGVSHDVRYGEIASYGIEGEQSVELASRSSITEQSLEDRLIALHEGVEPTPTDDQIHDFTDRTGDVKQYLDKALTNLEQIKEQIDSGEITDQDFIRKYEQTVAAFAGEIIDHEGDLWDNEVESAVLELTKDTNTLARQANDAARVAAVGPSPVSAAAEPNISERAELARGHMEIDSIGTDDDRVRAVQEMMQDAGYDLPAHGVDGKWGPETQKAYETMLDDMGIDYNASRDNPLSPEMMEKVMQNMDKTEKGSSHISDAEDKTIDAIAAKVGGAGTLDADQLREMQDAVAAAVADAGVTADENFKHEAGDALRALGVTDAAAIEAAGAKER